MLCTLLANSFAAEDMQPLTLADARARALQKHPKISIAALKALVAKAGVREARAAYLPNLSLNAGAVGAEDDNTRIVGSGLTVSSVFDRASVGATITQLVTDFGRTSNLRAGAKLRAEAEGRNVEATRAQILLQVDAAYYGALQAQALLRVAEETVKTRQQLRGQVSALASNQLKSELDVSFAEVALEEGRLLAIRASNDIAAAFATLAALLGSQGAERFALTEGVEPGPLPSDATEVIAIALRNRPDLQRLRLERDSAARLARAENSLWYPTVSVQATAGVIPYRERGLNQDYAAAGIILNWPIFSGGAEFAKQDAAALRAKAAEAMLLDEENNAVRDTRIALLNASNARERVTITERLLAQARRSYALADARYKAGSSSFVELGQAQLNQISAELGHTGARYEYLLRRSLLDYQTGALR
ncbi:MAG: TolC family protein [Verrucomicrobia bacterium]|nr:TolC family protein [Verrucomicrobiota bacterium]